VLAALNLVAVGLGIGAGGLSATILAFVASGLLGLTGADAPSSGLLVGIILGFAVGGWVAGRMAPHSERFHGAIAGLLLAGVYIVVARMGGSPAGTWSVLWLALIGAVVSGTAGWLAGRRKRAGS
jgi:LPXTG-motif cell wall-anchored protein